MNGPRTTTRYLSVPDNMPEDYRSLHGTIWYECLGKPQRAGKLLKNLLQIHARCCESNHPFSKEINSDYGMEQLQQDLGAMVEKHQLTTSQTRARYVTKRALYYDPAFSIEEFAKQQIIVECFEPKSVEQVRALLDPVRIADWERKKKLERTKVPNAEWESNEKLEHTKVAHAYAREHAYELMEALVKDDIVCVLE